MVSSAYSPIVAVVVRFMEGREGADGGVFNVLMCVYEAWGDDGGATVEKAVLFPVLGEGRADVSDEA